MIRFGVVGAGNMGRHHARILAELPGATLVGIYDVNSHRAAAVAASYGCRPFATLEGLLAAVDAVVVAVPTRSHYEVARLCLLAGRHTLVEKPLAATVAQAEELCALAASGPLLMVGYVERFNPAVARLRAELAEDEPLCLLFTRVGPEPPPGDGPGVILDLAIHDLDLLLYLTGRPVHRVTALAAGSSGREDSASLSFLLAGGCLAQVTVNWLTPFKVREIQVATRRRLLRCDLLRQELLAYSRHPASRGTYTVTELPVTRGEPLRLELAAFAAAIAAGREPPVPGWQGLASLRLAEDCQQQAARNAASL